MVRSDTQHSLPTYKQSKFVRTVGFIEKTDSLPINTDGKWDTDHVVEAIVAKLAPDYNPVAFGVASPSHFNVLESFKKYDKLDVYPEMPVVVKMNEDVVPGVMEFYASLWNQCRVISLDECYYTPDTSPGPMLKLLGLKNKKAVRSKLGNYIKWYTGGGWMVASSPLYKQNGKIELLKEAKMRDGVRGIRGFTIPPMDDVLLQCQYMQDMNLKIDAMGADLEGDCYSLVGANLREGGFTRLFNLLGDHAYGGGKLWKGDVIKMDSCETEMLLQNCRTFRVKCHDNVSATKEQFERVTAHIYDHMIHTYTLLPNGQIVQKKTGMPSGAFSTSNDGTFVHEQALAYHWVRTTDRPVSEMKRHVKAKLYCDDHLCAVDSPYAHVADFKERRTSYAQLGIDLSEEDDDVTETLEGMSLLGVEYRNGVPVPSRVQKFYHGLARPDGPRDVNTTLQRAVSFMDNAAFDDKLFAIAKTVADDALRRGAQWLVGYDDDWYHVPTQKECQNRWLGLESSSSYGKAVDLAASVKLFQQREFDALIKSSHLVL